MKKSAGVKSDATAATRHRSEKKKSFDTALHLPGPGTKQDPEDPLLQL